MVNSETTSVVLRAHAVAEMAEHQGSERTCNERDGEGQQAGQQRDGRIGGVSEEHLRGNSSQRRCRMRRSRRTRWRCRPWKRRSRIFTESRTIACALPAAASTALIGLLLLRLSCVTGSQHAPITSFFYSLVCSRSFRCLTPCGRQRKRAPAACRAINVCDFARLKPCLRWRGIEAALLESVRQRKRNNNSCGQQYACNHSVHRGEPPFAKSCIRRIIRSN